MSQVQTIRALRMAAALVKKNRFDTGRIQRTIKSKVGVNVDGRTIAGIRMSHRYQVGKALSLVM